MKNIKCKYCENKATKRDYRSFDGITSKVLVCDDCFMLNNEGVLNREEEVNRVKEEIFTFDEIDNVLDSSLEELWDNINSTLSELEEDMTNDFVSLTKQEPNEYTIENWRDQFIEKISKQLKKQI